MKKNVNILLSILLFACFLGLCSCAEKADTTPEYHALYDENGLYLEESFVYNAALEKNGARLIENGKTNYKIVYENTTDESVLAAIAELKKFFDLNCGGIPTEVYGGTKQDETIMIGKFLPLPDTALVKTGAYAIDISEKNIYIHANTVYGLTNGIYGFMEDYLGCMFLDRDTTYMPQVSTLIFEKKADVQEPAFESRDVGDNEVWGSKLFAQKLRVRQDETFLTNGCHNSMNRIAGDVLAEHPEYCALIGGKRSREQLCFSNPEVVDLLEEAVVREEQNNTTGQTIWWDISQQDNMSYCQCEKCAAQTKEANNAAAPIFRCVNTIAKRHPELKISTLAYHYGSTPPTGIEFEKNVMIKWCIMSSYGQNDYSMPLSEGITTIAQKQYDEIVGWADMVDHIYVWDYITDFFYYQIPFPCFEAMSGNIKLLRDLGMDGVFSLASYNHRGAFDRLKANYAAHLLWNPDFYPWEFIGKFVTIYFGKDAAPYLLQTYRLMQESVSSPLWVYDFPITHKEDYLSRQNVKKYMELYDAAVAACQGNETYQKRLRYEKISLLYTRILLGYAYGEDKDELKREFVSLCDEFGVRSFNEPSTDVVDNYRE